MYLDIDRWRAMNKIMKHTTPKDYGIFVNSKKAKQRGGAKRKCRRKNE